MEHTHKVDVPLTHQVDMGEAARYLVHKLGCDSWYVACHHDHFFVLHLSRSARDRYAARFECTSPVDKGIYHGGRAWSLAIVPLQPEEDLNPDMVKQIKAGLAELN